MPVCATVFHADRLASFVTPETRMHFHLLL